MSTALKELIEEAREQIWRETRSRPRVVDIAAAISVSPTTLKKLTDGQDLMEVSKDHRGDADEVLLERGWWIKKLAYYLGKSDQWKTWVITAGFAPKVVCKLDELERFDAGTFAMSQSPTLCFREFRYGPYSAPISDGGQSTTYQFVEAITRLARLELDTGVPSAPSTCKRAVDGRSAQITDFPTSVEWLGGRNATRTVNAVAHIFDTLPRQRRGMDFIWFPLLRRRIVAVTFASYAGKFRPTDLFNRKALDPFRLMADVERTKFKVMCVSEDAGHSFLEGELGGRAGKDFFVIPSYDRKSLLDALGDESDGVPVIITDDQMAIDLVIHCRANHRCGRPLCIIRDTLPSYRLAMALMFGDEDTGRQFKTRLNRGIVQLLNSRPDFYCLLLARSVSESLFPSVLSKDPDKRGYWDYDATQRVAVGRVILRRVYAFAVCRGLIAGIHKDHLPAAKEFVQHLNLLRLESFSSSLKDKIDNPDALFRVLWSVLRNELQRRLGAFLRECLAARPPYDADLGSELSNMVRQIVRIKRKINRNRPPGHKRSATKYLSAILANRLIPDTSNRRFSRKLRRIERKLRRTREAGETQQGPTL